MPNPGGMYLGCEKCRQRKIKVWSDILVEASNHHLIRYSAIEDLRVAGDVPFMGCLVQAILGCETSSFVMKP